ncbi:dihydrolipoyllysine-residue succinyltransferase component of 2-oxoglutarate dehydrogenase complex 1, mitochondrial-like [Camellia sinensis]|uniref:dihydrolipoyllysine-residue succinyltransferase component of 2-oxoglutarate dehydrogenase complex 1, mitochondrial-like n=1 Tax=Camellia sinensis TaxID=4442 RepID=UPI001036EA37|nr:dihydrolipoyllysine-residue succinyltransferase component of 2-oxoglutarate dehydrogenase complex 1, mitochondrial-like [Camellia sinensis]
MGPAINPRPAISLYLRREVMANILQPELVISSTFEFVRFVYMCNTSDLVEVVVPFMGESMSDRTLEKFLKNSGDMVEVDEPIFQIKTDKVTIDNASPEAGVIQKYVAKEGDTVEPSTKITVISKFGEGVAHVAPSEKTTDKAASQPPPVELSEEDKKKLKLKALLLYRSQRVLLLLLLNALLQNPSLPLKKGKTNTLILLDFGFIDTALRNPLVMMKEKNSNQIMKSRRMKRGQELGV